MTLHTVLVVAATVVGTLIASTLFGCLIGRLIATPDDWETDQP